MPNTPPPVLAALLLILLSLTLNIIQSPDKFGQRPIIAVICIHVLAQQVNLFHASLNQLLRLANDAGGWTRDLGAAGIGHHTKGAKLIATFLNR